MYLALLETSARGATLSVLLAIASFAKGKTDVAWPSYRAIQERAKVTRPTVAAAIAELETLGELAVEKQPRPGRGGKQLSNTYRLLTVVAARKGGKKHRPQVVKSTQKQGARSLLRTCNRNYDAKVVKRVNHLSTDGHGTFQHLEPARKRAQSVKNDNRTNTPEQSAAIVLLRRQAIAFLADAPDAPETAILARLSEWASRRASLAACYTSELGERALAEALSTNTEAATA